MARRTDGNGPAATDGAEQPVGRAVALAVLVVFAAVALRGYVPGAEEPARDRTADNPAATGLVLGLLIASIGIVAVAVVARLRSRSAPAAGTSGRPDWFRGERSRPTWRVLVVAFGVVVAWLLAVMVLNRLGATVAVGPPDAAVPASTQAVPTPSATAPPPQSGDPPDGSNLLGPFYGATVAFLVILVVGTVVASRRRRRGVAPAPADAHEDTVASDVATESLFRAAEVGLAEVEDLSREPRKAIIACYAAMEARTVAACPTPCPRTSTPPPRCWPAPSTPRPRAGQRDAAGRPVRRGAVQPARDERGPPRRRGRGAAAGARRTAEHAREGGRRRAVHATSSSRASACSPPSLAGPRPPDRRLVPWVVGAATVLALLTVRWLLERDAKTAVDESGRPRSRGDPAALAGPDRDPGRAVGIQPLGLGQAPAAHAGPAVRAGHRATKGQGSEGISRHGADGVRRRTVAVGGPGQRVPHGSD